MLANDGLNGETDEVTLFRLGEHELDLSALADLRHERLRDRHALFYAGQGVNPGVTYDPHEPTDALCDIPIWDAGEPMVDVLGISDRIFLDRPRFDYKRESLLRVGAAERLAQAADRLPTGYAFGLVEGWRPPFIQARMFRATWRMLAERYPLLGDEELRPLAERYTAPMDDRVPPPHTTGAAFDLALYRDGAETNLMEPFEWLDPEGFAFDAPGLSDAARFARDVLAGAFEGTGITNYPSEYWHWSYGDQGWAYRGGHPEALYGAVEPPGWTPEARDAVDAPLEWIEGTGDRASGTG